MHGDAWPNFVTQSPIRWLKVKDSLLAWENLDTHMFLKTFDVSRFKNKFAAEDEKQDNPFSNASELNLGNPEWQRKLLINEKMLLFGSFVALKMSMLGKVAIASTRMIFCVVNVRFPFVRNVNGN